MYESNRSRKKVQLYWSAGLLAGIPLKGSYKIDHTLRAKLNLDHNILTGSAKSWRDIKCVVRDYLDCSEVWEDQPQQFVLLLQKSLKAIITYLSKQPTNNVQTNELLLKEYCSNLDTFYHNPRIINAVKKLYQTLELKKRDEDNLQQAHIQSSATASAMVIEKSRMMEITSKKRLFDEVEDEVDCLEAFEPRRLQRERRCRRRKFLSLESTVRTIFV